MKYRLKHLLEYTVIRTFMAFLIYLPYPLALAFGWLIAFILHGIFRFRRKEAYRRIQEVLGDQAQAKRIAWVSFRNICFNAIEMLRIQYLSSNWFKQHTQFKEGVARIKSYHEQGRPVILAVAHMGNWDLAGQAIEREGINALFIMRNQKNPLVNRLMNQQREAMGSRVIDRDNPRLIKEILRHLKQGGTMAMLIDLRSRTPGTPLRFLGKDADIASGLGLIARQANAVILPARTVRKGWFRHDWSVGAPIEPDLSCDKKSDQQRLTQEALDALSAYILEQPEQYFWYNKRWVLERHH